MKTKAGYHRKLWSIKFDKKKSGSISFLWSGWNDDIGEKGWFGSTGIESDEIHKDGNRYILHNWMYTFAQLPNG